MPNVHTTEELYGRYEEGVWEEGVLARILQHSYEQARAAEWNARHSREKDRDKEKAGEKPAAPAHSPIQKWMVLDGALDATWVEGLHTVLDDTKMLSLANGGHVKLHGKMLILTWPMCKNSPVSQHSFSNYKNYLGSA